jgi:hypothetical protein
MLLLSPYRYVLPVQLFANVKLLLHCNGSNGSTTFTDSSSSPKTTAANGNAQLSTAQIKYGSASALFDGNGDYLSVTYNSDLSLISGDWTIEAWIYPTATEGAVINKDGVSGSSYSQYSLGINSSGYLSGFLGNGNGTSPTGTSYAGSTTVSLNAWHHVAMVSTGGTCKGFLDGVQQWSSAAATMYEGSKALLIGYQSGQPTAEYFDGYIDDIRITKGTAIYTANFTPPVAQFPDS